jgi:hypothetical protein
MLAFHTAGDPPSWGRIILAIIGWTVNTRAALVKMAPANNPAAGRRKAGARREMAVINKAPG